MNRKYMIEVLNNQILPQINSRWMWADIMSAKEILRKMQEYRTKCIKAGTAKGDDTLTAKVINGFLYLNNSPICRIAPLDPKPSFDEVAYYWEGRILARQENYGG